PHGLMLPRAGGAGERRGAERRLTVACAPGPHRRRASYATLHASAASSEARRRPHVTGSTGPTALAVGVHWQGGGDRRLRWWTAAVRVLGRELDEALTSHLVDGAGGSAGHRLRRPEGPAWTTGAARGGGHRLRRRPRGRRGPGPGPARRPHLARPIERLGQPARGDTRRPRGRRA